MGGLIEALRLIGDLLLALVTAIVLRPRRQRHEHGVFIRAPLATVWRVLRSRDLTYPGRSYMRVITEPVPGRPDLERSRCLLPNRDYDIITRIIDERVEQALLSEIMPEGTNPGVIIGDDDFLGMVVKADAGGTWLYLSREFTPTRWYSPAVAKFGLRTGAQRYKAVAELAATADKAPAHSPAAQAFVASQAPPPAPKTFNVSRNSILISLIALASFSYMWGWQFALLLAAIIMLHELGHALAMIMVGIPVRGVYLVPFLGGAAVAATPYRSEGQAGFVALMGPGFSLFPTLALAIAAHETGNDLLFRAAELSAIINLINLLPIIPLDGGQVVKSALISLNKSLALVVAGLGTAGGFWLAWTFRDPVIALVAALGLLIIRQIKAKSELTVMRWPLALLLLVSLALTVLIYAVIIYHLQRFGRTALL
jgi:Zn-dependent protease